MRRLAKVSAIAPAPSLCRIEAVIEQFLSGPFIKADRTPWSR